MLNGHFNRAMQFQYTNNSVLFNPVEIGYELPLTKFGSILKNKCNLLFITHSFHSTFVDSKKVAKPYPTLRFDPELIYRPSKKFSLSALQCLLLVSPSGPTT